MLDEFKKFAIKGNIIDMSVGVIIGTAFGKIITSLVNDIVMPLMSTLTGKIDFTKLFIALDGKTYENIEVAKDAGASTLNYGAFITSVIDFLIIAFCIFIFVNKLIGKKKKDEPVTTKFCPYCKTKIDMDAIRCPNCTSELIEKELLFSAEIKNVEKEAETVKNS